MKMRWLAAGLAAVLITGGAATVAQRVITQKTRGVLPEADDPAHADSRHAAAPSVVTVRLAGDDANPLTPPPASAPAATPAPATIAASDAPPPGRDDPALELPEHPPTRPIAPTVAMIEPTPGPIPEPGDPAPASTPAQVTADRAISPAGGSIALAEPAAVAASAPPPAASPDVPTKADPVDAVETFVERNRKEAEAAIQSLTSEAEGLKTRLAKVEVALVRWQNFSRALNTDQPSAPADAPAVARPKWNRSAPAAAERPLESPRTEESPKPVPDLAAEARAPETPAEPPVASPVEPPNELEPAPAPARDKSPTEPAPAAPAPKS